MGSMNDPSYLSENHSWSSIWEKLIYQDKAFWFYIFLFECADHKLGYLEAERGVSRVISRRDVATQMSPEGSTYSSPKGNSSFSAFPLPIPAAVEQHNYNSAEVEIRDVQVDKGATITRQSKKLGARRMRRKSSDFKELASTWEISGAAKTLSKYLFFLF